MAKSNTKPKLELTATQARMMDVLKDGLFHSRSELHRCCKQGTMRSTVKVHIHHLRKKLQPLGRDIICEYRNQMFGYRIVIPIGKDD